MSEYRQDPLVQRWVVMAPERALRPIEVHEEPQLVEMGIDPFSEGNEAETTPEVFAIRDEGSIANGPGWRVRVVPNKYPAVQRNSFPEQNPSDVTAIRPGTGAHEVIIECPHCEPNMSRLATENIADVLRAYRQRLLELKRDPRLIHATIFKNQGALAGASVHHSHSQLIAVPFVPPTILEELQGAREFYERTGGCLFEHILKQELEERSRIVFESPRLLAYCPYASRFSYETWIVPRRPGSHFEQVDNETLRDLALILKAVLRSLELNVNDPPFNFVLHSAPFRMDTLPYYRWHIEILPRLSRVAGFEWGSGCFINQVLPEEAAQRLRIPV